MKRDLDTNLNNFVQSNQTVAVKQFEQNKKIKMLKTKIDLLETNLSQIVQDFEKERELIKFQNEQIIREQNEELRTLTESNKLKIKESTNLKALCQMILDQRSDIEQFFLEAQEQVKEEKRRRLETQRAIQLQEQSKNNFSMNLSSSEHLSNMASQKITVELGDLDWEDRERILRLLFSKMNTGQSAAHWRDAPGNSKADDSRAPSGLNQSFREQEEEDYDGEGEEEEETDARVFEQTNLPPENYMPHGQAAANHEYYDEEDNSGNN
jgi:hypothetical protein